VFQCEKTGEKTPDFLELLDETHRKADGSFINEKSEEIYKQVTSRIEEEESHMGSGTIRRALDQVDFLFMPRTRYLLR